MRNCLLLALCAGIMTSAAHAGEMAVKWNPGHYMLVWKGYDQGQFDKTAGTRFKGVQVRYSWRDLEPEKDAYDFSAIESDLAHLQSLGKHLVIQLMDRQFRSKERPLPDYIYDDPQYNGGVEPFKSKGGTVARLWDPTVMGRFIALVDALGKRFDAEPNFEALVFAESAIGIDKANAPGFTHRKYLDALKDRATAAKRAFPHTTVIQYANWLAAPEGALDELAEHLAKVGVGWGGPDIVPDKTEKYKPAGQKRIAGYDQYPMLAGKVPLGAAAQAPSFGGKEGAYTLEELLDMAVNTLHLNYMFWICVEGPQYSHSFTNDIIPFIDKVNGKINTAPPECVERAR